MKNKFVFQPTFFKCLKGYNGKQFSTDLMAGIIVGIVAIPLAIAFGIASGVGPTEGLVTAIIAGFLISLLGGTKVQIGGPTGAFIVIIYGIIQQHGLTGLMIATIMAGIMLILMGVFKLGTIIKFVPYPVIVGFTGGIALTIFSTQMNDFFGLGITDVPADFLHKWWCYIQHTGDINWWSFGIALMSLLIIIFTPKISSKVPGSLVAIIVATLAVWLLDEFTAIEGVKSISTIGDLYTLPQGMPAPTLPELSLKEGETILGVVQSLFPAAFTIAILGAIESLLSAMVVDGVIGDKHDSNTELIGQGIANVVVPFFGGIPATGAIARTMTNINNGGRTPIAGIIHAIVLVLILLVLMPYAKYIPMATLAGVLLVVSYNMSGWRTFKGLMKNPKSDVTVLLVTFFLTVIFDLTIAIEIGLIIACALFIKRVMETTEISVIEEEIHPSEESEECLSIPEGCAVYEINGPYFFGIANKFEELESSLKGGSRPKVQIIRMRRVPFIDSTGIHNLTTLIEMNHENGTEVILAGITPKVQKQLLKAKFHKVLPSKNFCNNIDEALRRAEEILK